MAVRTTFAVFDRFDELPVELRSRHDTPCHVKAVRLVLVENTAAAPHGLQPVHRWDGVNADNDNDYRYDPSPDFTVGDRVVTPLGVRENGIQPPYRVFGKTYDGVSHMGATGLSAVAYRVYAITTDTWDVHALNDAFSALDVSEGREEVIHLAAAQAINEL